jgi:ceroid-lipofuscinosis MFS transporter 7
MSLRYDAVETDEGGRNTTDLEAKSSPASPTSPSPSQWTPSLATVGVVIFLGDCSRGILFPVLWALCHELGGGVLDLGYVVAVFSLGRLLVTVPLGYFCDHYRHRLSLLIASTMLCCGAILWANVYLLALGLGSGSLGVTRSFIAEQLPPSQRTQTLGMMTALQVRL